ncbi:MAG: hypothetical protein OEW92_14285, partial [Gammaproteobacteria bacterium]|nr:hypothetical protein [Gammaproteobacteria bacterium]
MFWLVLCRENEPAPPACYQQYGDNTAMRSLPGLYLLLLVVLGLPACSQPAVKDEVCAGFAAENLYRVQNSGFAEACARRDAALSGYRLIDIEPLGVSHIDIPRTNVPGT